MSKSAGMKIRRPGQRSKPSEKAIRELEKQAEGIASKTPGKQPKGKALAVEGAGGGTVSAPRVRRGDGVATRSTTVTLPVDLAEKLRARAFQDRKRQSAVVAEALAQYLDS